MCGENVDKHFFITLQIPKMNYFHLIHKNKSFWAGIELWPQSQANTWNETESRYQVRNNIIITGW